MNLVFILILVHSASALSLVIDDEQIENPRQYLSDRLSRSSFKSKFRQYLPDKQKGLVVPVVPGKAIGELPNTRYSKAKQYAALEKIHHFWFPNQEQVEKDAAEENDVDQASSSIAVDSFEDVTLQILAASYTTTMTLSASTTQVSTSAEPTASFNPSVTVSSKKSWIKEFLYFTTKARAATVAQKQIDRDRLLTTNINNYQDTTSNENDLKRWTKLIVEQGRADSSSKFQDYNYKEYGLDHKDPNNFTPKNEIELNIEEFISYLVNFQGFQEKDLKFLRQKGLDYGLVEIEKELNKIKDLERDSNNRIIDIGGEEDMLNGCRKEIIVGWKTLFIMLVSVMI
ncbi:hypothetical protein G9P44_003829 [Scheffersomyces stipitis]|nr:hypothetical protein G9P44_003829 [Scheffersomyces stipitis]